MSDSGFRIQGWIQGFGLRLPGLGCRVLELVVWGIRLRA